MISLISKVAAISLLFFIVAITYSFFIANSFTAHIIGFTNKIKLS